MAITRAGSKMLVITTLDIEDLTCMQNNSTTHRVLSIFLQYAYQMSNNNLDAVKSILSTIGAIDVVNKADNNLKQNTFEQLNSYLDVAKYKIAKDEIVDFMIYDLSHKITYALTCSGGTNGRSVREQYIKLPQFFSSRGIESYMFLDNVWQI